jgi:hypothetical protein
MQLTTTPPPSTAAPQFPYPVPGDGSTVLAQFSYAIRGPKGMPRMAIIEAHAWPRASYPVRGSFEDAVAAAKLHAATEVRDGIHNVRINQAHGVLQAADGTFAIVPLGGPHRDQEGPLFVDGRMFEAAALSLQVTRSVAELVAVVGRDRVLDLRHTGSAFVAPANQNPPAPR